MKDRNEVPAPATCTGCNQPLEKDPRGPNTCRTSGCGGNLLERFPIAEESKPKAKRRRGRRKSARN